jgi:hypothetical protein
LVSIGLVLSEEKIFEKVYDDNGRQVMAIAHEGSGELINHIFANLMELEGISTKDLYTKLILCLKLHNLWVKA